MKGRVDKSRGIVTNMTRVLLVCIFCAFFVTLDLTGLEGGGEEGGEEGGGGGEMTEVLTNIKPREPLKTWDL